MKMNEGQERFYQFMLERVQEDRQEEVKEMLAESFAKQADGTFDAAYMTAFVPKIMAMVKPEDVEEVQNVMQGFAKNM